jgi:hypothetical protein
MITQQVLARVMEIAATRGGSCVGSHDGKVRLRCSEEHEWEAIARNVVHGGTWCPTCARQKRSVKVDDVSAIARARGGECLSRALIDSTDPSDTTSRPRRLVVCKCQLGHVWETDVRTIKAGSWCPVCARKTRKLPREKRHTMDEMASLARTRGGACVSEVQEFPGVTEKLLWRCHREHEWFAAPRNVMRGSWCPVCAAAVKRPSNHMVTTIEDVVAAAAARGGECLSPRYVHSSMKMAWRCSEGHLFHANLARVNRGYWCPACKRLEGSLPPVDDIDAREELRDLHSIARLLHHGSLLSRSYTSKHAPLRWRCEKGHEFSMSAAQLRDILWCPVCDPDWWFPHRTIGSIGAHELSMTLKLTKKYRWHGSPTRRFMVRELDPSALAIAEPIALDLARRSAPAPRVRREDVIGEYLAGKSPATWVINAFFPRYLSPHFLEMCTPVGAPFGWMCVKLQPNNDKKASIDLFFADGFDYEAITSQIWRAIEPFAYYIIQDDRKPETRIVGAVPGGIMPDEVYNIINTKEMR